MATHPSTLAWRIPGLAEPGGLPSMALQSRTRLKQLSSSIRLKVLGSENQEESESLPGSLLGSHGRKPSGRNTFRK